MSGEREAIREEQLRHNPDDALIEDLFEALKRKTTALRSLWKKYKSAKAEGWDEGQSAGISFQAGGEYIENPYRKQEEA